MGVRGRGPANKSERSLQISLYYFLRLDDRARGYELIVPNLYLYHWESDMIAILRSGFVCEFEVKASVPDFRADFKKEKHRVLRGGAVQRDLSGSFTVGQVLRDSLVIPGYFYYVAPAGLIDPGDLPRYAGLITVDGSGDCGYVVRGPKLTRRKVTDDQYRRIARSLAYRYMDQITKEHGRFTEIPEGPEPGQGHFE